MLLGKNLTSMKETDQNLNKKTSYFDDVCLDLLRTDQQNKNHSMESFLSNMNSILDVDAPLKKS